jgi:3-hydroxyacyl-[acyl-carrier-protein] dehydratase
MMQETNPYQNLIDQLPYKAPFLFVDKIIDCNESSIKGTYKLKPNEYFYEGHFPDHPVTPGIILTEICAQIGLVSLALFISNSEKGDLSQDVMPLFSSSNMEFLKPVYPGEEVTVSAQMVYFRFGKLKCEVQMFNEAEEKVCYGQLSGMIIKKKEDNAE